MKILSKATPSVKRKDKEGENGREYKYRTSEGFPHCNPRRRTLQKGEQKTPTKEAEDFHKNSLQNFYGLQGQKIQ